MNFLPNPYAILVALALIVGSYFYGHHEGSVQAKTEAALTVAKLNEAARKEEQEHTQILADIGVQLIKEKQNAKAANDRYLAAVRAGDERLYVNVRPVPAGEGSTPASGDRPETRAELDPTTAAGIIAITNDGDDAIRQLNSCIDAYNAIQK